MEDTMKTCIVNSDEFTGGNDEVWDLYVSDSQHGNAMAYKGNKRLRFSWGHEAPFNNATTTVNGKFVGSIRPITFQQAEDHPFIVKFGAQANARYYGVFEA